MYLCNKVQGIYPQWSFTNTYPLGLVYCNLSLVDKTSRMLAALSSLKTLSEPLVRTFILLRQLSHILPLYIGVCIKLLYMKTMICLVQMTDDRLPIIDQVPAHPNIVFAAGMSGEFHASKHHLCIVIMKW